MSAWTTRIAPIVLLVTLAGLVAVPRASAQTNYWTSPASDRWDTNGAWSLGVPPSSDQFVYITNAGTKTVTIDAATATNFTSSMTVSNLILGAPTNFVNTLSLDTSGVGIPLQVLGNLGVQRGGTINVSNATLQVDGLTRLGAPGFPGALGVGALTINSSAAAQVSDINVGDSTNSSGVVNLFGGSLEVAGTLTLAGQPVSSTGVVTMTGGTLLHTNGTMLVGSYGTGTFVQSGGSNLTGGLQLGNGSGSMGRFTLSNAALVCSSLLRVGSTAGGSALCNFQMQNATVAVANAGGTGELDVSRGVFTLLSGLLQADNLHLSGPSAIFKNMGGTFQLTAAAQLTNGTMSLLGGTNSFSSGMSVGGGGSTTTVAIASSAVAISSNLTIAAASNSSVTFNISTNASVTATNGLVAIGSGGSGQMNISGGVTTLGQVKLGGSNSAGSGTLQMTGGHLRILSSISANFIIVCGGDLDGTGGTVIIGELHDATFQVCGGMATNFNTMFVGYSANFLGTFAQSGGIASVTNSMIVGDCAGGAVGAVTLSGGTLYVTNANHNATLVVSDGTFQLNSGGNLVVDTLVLTSACGHFIKNGGTLQARNIVLDPNLDADGDGQSNTNEFLAGTDPLDPSSSFLITAIAQEGNDVRVTWTTVEGRDYVLQATPYLTNGPGTPFVDLNPVIVATNTGTTNLVHSGIINGAPARFYRVRTPALLSADNASDPAYSPATWSSGLNGGVGFGAWTLTASGGGGGGFFVGDSANNGTGASGNINTVGNTSWGVSAHGGALCDAVRSFNAVLGIGQVLKLDMDNGTVDTGGSVGFSLRNGAAADQFQFFINGGIDNHYQISDGGGIRDTPIVLNADGMHIEFKLTTAASYSITITLSNGSQQTFTGNLSASGPVTGIHLFNHNAGNGAAHDAYFNSLQIER
jgi:hypothetical protein